MTELAAIRQVTNEYYRTLTAGRADPETELPKFLDALNNAGLETVLAEEQEPTGWRAPLRQVIFDTISTSRFITWGWIILGRRERGRVLSFLPKIKEHVPPSVPPT